MRQHWSARFRVVTLSRRGRLKCRHGLARLLEQQCVPRGGEGKQSPGIFTARPAGSRLLSCAFVCELAGHKSKLPDRGIRVCLTSARHMKNVPGRRTDWHECQWVAIPAYEGTVAGSISAR